jgi:hypothetical protein
MTSLKIYMQLIHQTFALSIQQAVNAVMFNTKYLKLTIFLKQESQ